MFSLTSEVKFGAAVCVGAIILRADIQAKTLKQADLCRRGRGVRLELLPALWCQRTCAVEAVRGLSDHDLAQLQTLLASLSFGQETGDKLESSDSFFNRVARDLKMDMRNHWRPNASFFAKRNREQLVSIAKECGYADGHGSVGSYKKSELIASRDRGRETAGN
jgi:hypothetical protein